jgi:hypothetical protein
MKRPMMRRRRNGVGAYHIYLGDLLKTAKYSGKGQSAADRKQSFKAAQKEALRLKGKYGDKYVVRAKARNTEVQGVKKVRRAKRKEKGEKVTFRYARKMAGGMTAYRGLKRKERVALRKTRFKRKVGADPRAKQAMMLVATKQAPSLKAAWAIVKGGKAAAPARRRRTASAEKFTGAKTTKTGRTMYYVGGKLVSKAAYEAGGMKSNPSKRRRKASRKASRKGMKVVGRRGLMRRLRNTGGEAVSGAKSFYSDVFSVAGAATAVTVGVAHGYVAPMVAEALDTYLPGKVSLPVIGEVGASNLTYTITGLAAGGLIMAVGYGFGTSAAHKQTAKNLAMLAAGSGLVMDTVGLTQNALGYGVIDNRGDVYGDVAYGNVAYGEIHDEVSGGPLNYGGVMADGVVEYGSVVGAEYGDAMPADAEDSGADFNAAEGQAMMEGPASWFRRFGRSPKRVSGVRSAKSRHAGREGHRWGWLIKLVGMDKAAQIAALPPERRLQVIASLRKQAVDSLANLMNEQAAHTTAPVATQNLLSAPQDMGLDFTGAAMGAGGSYGTVMYAGGGF